MEQTLLEQAQLQPMEPQFRPGSISQGMGIMQPLLLQELLEPIQQVLEQ
jgi:hypothetical protein